MVKHKIIIIEDEPSIAEMYKFKLEAAGYDVRMALNGKEGLELITSFKPALILLDLMMPEMGGEEVLEKLRAKDGGDLVKVIILTNISKDVAPQKLRFMHVDRYIIKANYTPAQVAELVAEVLGEKKAN